MDHLGQHAYEVSLQIAKSDPPFYSLIAAAAMKADSRNTELIKAAWPEVWEETQQRYNAPGGMLEREMSDD